ncbi:hypothetical protein B5807_11893 [Epicoccum nigrum]|uniref:Rhodopsin domain-containing protein n=1 Tax=Epicoccum nigrum TaxID=105696 RepID=A0A1Y2LHY6_EPING|nr:hypothetical protein B5807_11893 [Epicoccum nigrum]
MRVDAASAPASTIRALVATLGCVALLTCLARACAAGRAGWRSMRGLRAEEGVVFFAAACVMGDLVITMVVQSQRRGLSDGTAEEVEVGSTLLWADSLVQMVGLGLVKIAIALMVFRLAARSWLRSTAVGYICATTVLTVFWFGSSLLLDGPITLAWDTAGEPHAAARLLVSINSTLDLLTTVAATLLPIPLLWTSYPSTSTKCTLLVAYALATAAIAAASFRTYLVYSTRLTHPPSPTSLTALASSIELSTGLTAALLPSLLSSLLSSSGRPSSSSFSQITNYVPQFTTKAPPTTRTATATLSTNASAPRYHSFRSSSSRHTYGSTSTAPRHPTTAPNRAASGIVPLRYHDNESNVEFELLTPTRARSRAGTPRSYPQSLRSYPQSLRSYPQSLDEAPLPLLNQRGYQGQYPGQYQYAYPYQQQHQQQHQQQQQRHSRPASVWNAQVGFFVAAPRRCEAATGGEQLQDGMGVLRAASASASTPISASAPVSGGGERESGEQGEGEGEADPAQRRSAIGVAPQIAGLGLRGEGERAVEGDAEQDGEEMAQLRRLFQDGEVMWGALDGSPAESGARLGRYRSVRI